MVSEKAFYIQRGLKTSFMTIQNAFLNEQSMYVSFLDVQTEYDRTNKQILLILLQQLKLLRHYLIITWKLLKSRTNEVHFDHSPKYTFVLVYLKD